jgi:hypothetical protein
MPLVVGATSPGQPQPIAEQHVILGHLLLLLFHLVVKEAA